MSRADEAAWRVYVGLELQAFYDHCAGITYIWQHTPAAERLVKRLGGDSELAAYRGPWHVIRSHVTTEFQQWVEEYRLLENRLTPSDWRARAIAERAEVAWVESPDYTLGQLSELRRLISERDSLIVEASKRGAAKVAIADAVGLSRQQVHTIIANAELAPVIPIRSLDVDIQAFDVEQAPEMGESRMTADGTVAYWTGEGWEEPF